MGWWTIPEAERSGNINWSSTIVFVECRHPPACLGAPNRALEKRFYDPTSGADLAMVGTANATSICATTLGFRNESRLCHTCNSSSRRLGGEQCLKCPGAGQNWGLMVLGIFVAVIIICFLVGSTIGDAGNQDLSSTIRKILLNHMQVASLAQAFPLRWPSALRTLFEFQGAVSTLGDVLVNPDCAVSSFSSAELFYFKQASFASIPFLTVIMAFIVWYVYGSYKKTPFFAKREQRDSSKLGGSSENKGTADTRQVITPKDKFVVTVTVVIYLIYPTLSKQAFEIFDCRDIGGSEFLAVDLEQPCYTGNHMTAVLTLGLGQMLVFGFGLPFLMILFLRRNRKHPGGLDRHVVRVRYGLFFGAFTDDRYYWELSMTNRKLAIVAISVVWKSSGAMLQAQLALAVLFLCVILEITAKPYKIETERHKVLSRLELASLYSLWGTMWCGTLIFTLQDWDGALRSEADRKSNDSLIVCLSVLVATMNLGIILWLVFQLLVEMAFEAKDSKLGKCIVGRKCFKQAEPCVDAKPGVDTQSVEIELSTAGEVNPSPGVTWTREFDESCSRFYLYNEETGESKWGEGAKSTQQFVELKTEEGERYYMPASGEGETTWVLPQGAEIVELSEKYDE